MSKNIEMNYKISDGYEVIYPQVQIQNVINLQESLDNKLNLSGGTMQGPLILSRNPQEQMEAVSLGYLGGNYSMRVLETKTAHVSYSYNIGAVDVSSLLPSNFEDWLNITNILVNVSCNLGGDAPFNPAYFGISRDSASSNPDIILLSLSSGFQNKHYNINALLYVNNKLVAGGTRSVNISLYYPQSGTGNGFYLESTTHLYTITTQFGMTTFDGDITFYYLGL